LEPVRLRTSSKFLPGGMMQLLREMSGYGVASVAALAVDVALLWMLAHMGLHPVLAATLSFSAGAFVAYFLAVRIAFYTHRWRDRRLEFAGFFAIGLAALAINALVIFVTVQWLGLHLLLGKCVAAGCTFTFNFFARRQLLFVTPERLRNDR